MASSNKSDLSIDKVMSVSCQNCGGPMKKVSWKITAGASDAGKEVEQTVFQCDRDKAFVCVEVSTGNPSEFAVDVGEY